MTTRRRRGWVAGLLYLALAVTSTVGLGIPGSFMVRGEILIILWLLIKGAQSEPADDQQLRPA